MDKDKFFQYLQNNTILDNNSLKEIKTVCDEYPYFQTAHILLIKNLRKLRKSDYFENLKKNIVFISNKEILYQHINTIDYLLTKDNDLRKDTKKENDIKEKLVTHKKDDQVNKVKNTDIKVESEKKKIKAKDDDYFELDLSESVQSEITTETKKAKPDNNNLIDEFITSQPRIIPKEKPLVENIDISEESVMDKEDYMTETLAKVYIKQGYYSKAMFIYEKLRLKYPEKSTYFAAQIEKVKKLSNKL